MCFKYISFFSWNKANNGFVVCSYIVEPYQQYVYIEIILFAAPATVRFANLNKYKEASTKKNMFFR